jgi:MinD superfamily P-loop ATPase
MDIMDTKTVSTEIKNSVESDKPVRIAIASGKGGTGKTLVATNLFYALQQQDQKITLVDCDAEEPNAVLFFTAKKSLSFDVLQKVPVIDVEKCTFCLKCHDYCNYNAIFAIPPAGIIHVIDELCHSCGACSVACSFNAVHDKDVIIGCITDYELSTTSRLIESRTRAGIYSPVPVIKAALAESQGDNYVIYDAPPGTSCPFIQTVAKADYVILITEPTPFGLSDLKQSVDTLRQMNKKFGVVVNRAGIGSPDVFNYLKNEGILLLMEIPFDKKVAFEYAQGNIIAKSDLTFQTELLGMFHRVKDLIWN